MATFADKFKEILAGWLVSRGVDAVSVSGWLDNTYRSGGGCPTCSYDVQEIWIDYFDASGVGQSYLYLGTFSELLDQLLEVEVG